MRLAVATDTQMDTCLCVRRAEVGHPPLLTSEREMIRSDGREFLSATTRNGFVLKQTPKDIAVIGKMYSIRCGNYAKPRLRLMGIVALAAANNRRGFSRSIMSIMTVAFIVLSVV